MAHVLHIEANSEAEKYFMQLIGKTNAKNVKVSLSILHEGILCNDYTIDDETYNSIKLYLEKDRG